MYYSVLVASQRFHGKESLTYESSDSLAMGQLVAVALQQKSVVGIVESIVEKPDFKTKSIIHSWPFFVPPQSLRLLHWLAIYYPSPLGLITELFTPPSMVKRAVSDEQRAMGRVKPAVLPPLTAEQSKTLKTIEQSKQQNFILHGDTGTGKTRIYIELAKRALENGQSSIILTPEIGLTKPLLDTFTQSFGERAIVTHSDMTPAERRAVWLKASSGTGLVIIGPRSALFSPLKNIGLIVMDEAHDSAYKQEQSPYYQTSRVAAQLARLHGASFIMGTATPPIADYFAFDKKNLPILRMVEPAIKNDQKTSIDIIDYRDKSLFTRSPWLANSLLNAIDLAIKNGEQTLLFLNRRGSARLVLCNNCGWQALCPHCDVALTYHQDEHLMRCHSCDFKDSVPTNCPSCGGSELIFRSIGTKALESEVHRLFPQARVNRFDRDTEKAERLSQHYQALKSGEVDILIGTQTIAKGFDLPKLGVVGIVAADSGLQIPDFTATERTYQLISQVSGRVGRGHRAGKLYVQTFDPESSLISVALSKDYQKFYLGEIQQRQLYGFPPYSFLLKITCARASSKSAQLACQKMALTIRQSSKAVVVEGPSPRFIEKIAGRYAWHLVVKSKHRQHLLDIIRELPSNTSYDLDPSDLL